MYFGRIHHPHNFTFVNVFKAGEYVTEGILLAPGDRNMRGYRYGAGIEDCGDGVFHLRVDGQRWKGGSGRAGLHHPPVDAPRFGACAFRPDGGFALADGDGTELLRTRPDTGIGACGKAWLIEFATDPDLRFYGMGEKIGPLEKTGARTTFWNSEGMDDFADETVHVAKHDPLHVSVPYLILKRGNRYVGILLNNPRKTFCSANGRIGPVAGEQDEDADARFYLGAEDGAIDVYLLIGPSLAGLTAKFQRLCGTTPLPPLWALGHHQCRRGNTGPEDLREMDAKFAEHAIPDDGLWLAPDYMHGYRAFTWDPASWPDPAAAVADLQTRGRRVVPILDPGVKDEPGYVVRESGKEAEVFCQTPEGTDFVGYAWPGAALFPDFSRLPTRRWWAELVRRFVAASGVDGVWLDANDPSVGPVEPDTMRFGKGGRQAHAIYHNQYANGMAEATRAGLLKARRDRRPFIVSRSACTGMSRHAAVWTDDNLSPAAHLATAIPRSLNLALSGIPFNGPDIGGFGRKADADLAQRWYQAGFLFPFCRNRSCSETRAQEPWAFDAPTLAVARDCIRLRYKLLPYLYNLFIEQEETGAAILRPLIHDFDSTPDLDLDRIDDQFLVGPALMQAPFLVRDASEREVVLPPGGWFDPAADGFCEGGAAHVVTRRPEATPLYLRAGHVLPMQVGMSADTAVDLAAIELHCVLRPGEAAALRYRADDGESYAYRRGSRSELAGEVVATGRDLRVRLDRVRGSWRPIAVRIVAYGPQERLLLETPDGERLMQPLAPHSWTLAGHPVTSRRGEAVVLD